MAGGEGSSMSASVKPSSQLKIQRVLADLVPLDGLPESGVTETVSQRGYPDTAVPFLARRRRTRCTMRNTIAPSTDRRTTSAMPP
jgi:hypothetical protein